MAEIIVRLRYSLAVSRYCRSMSRFHNSDLSKYENAVRKLNSLQSNASVLKAARKRGNASHIQQAENIDQTAKYLQRTGIKLETLDKLSFIHVAGTKGKGSSCALCESILRENGYKTGFFSSPHLVSVRERIRINGAPLTAQQFVKHFERVYELMDKQKEHDDDMPSYFKFLTVMAFNVFLLENVDVSIVEVGVGGEYDCTNVIRKPAVVGITSLGLDHTSLLGDTVDKIAWQKAGIMKPGAVAITVPQKSSKAMRVLKDRAANRKCRLLMAPTLESYTWDQAHGDLSNMDHIHFLNTSLALQMSREWMMQQSPFIELPEVEENGGNTEGEDSDSIKLAPSFMISEKTMKGLSRCSWPGRTQILRRRNVVYFLDGAHTLESLGYCRSWFGRVSKNLIDSIDTQKILIFNMTGDRPSKSLLQVLAKIDFDYVLFTSNAVHTKVDNKSDLMNFNTKFQQQEDRCHTHMTAWEEIMQDRPGNRTIKVLPSVSQALEVVSTLTKVNIKCHVLVTGSLHLVGATLSLLDPDLQESVYYMQPDLKPLLSLYDGVQAIL